MSDNQQQFNESEDEQQMNGNNGSGEKHNYQNYDDDVS